MNLKRVFRSLRLCLITSGTKRAAYLQKNKVFSSMGDNCIFMNRKVPLYPKLIKLGHHVIIAPNVVFATHDAVHKMFVDNPELTAKYGLTENNNLKEKIGCIEIGDNVFIGADTVIMNNVKIGNEVVIGAGSIITKDIPDNSIVAGVPAKVICPFDKYVTARMTEGSYPANIAPAGQETSTALTEWCWKHFEEQRK